MPRLTPPLLLVLLVVVAGCRTPPWDEWDDGGPRLPAADGPRARDLAAPRDALGARDLSLPRDLARTDWALAPDCAPGTDVIYLLDEDRMLSRFRPDTLAFTNLGRITCPGMLGTLPNSMAVQRDGTAWVSYYSGELFKVDLRNVRCSATPFQVGQLGTAAYGMGFTADVAGGAAETLHVATQNQDLTEFWLGRIDLQTFRLTRLGHTPWRGELTGSGDGRLWGFFPATGRPRIIELDKRNAAEIAGWPVPIPGTGRDWFAFARWSGDFYIFLQREADASTKVYRLRPGDGSLVTLLDNTGRSIVGAGVSTCAP